jgi:hypothetical protein
MALAPAIWFERARGRKRLALFLLYASIALVVALFGAREAQLAGLPIVPEPFDVDAFRRDRIDLAGPPYSLYAEAERLLPDASETRATFFRLSAAPDWAAAGPEERAFHLRCQAALARFRDASAQGAPVRTRAAVVRDARDPQDPRPGLVSWLGRRALLEASRQLRSGKPDEAWTWILAALRASRHSQWTNRSDGFWLVDAVATSARTWGEDPSVTEPLLRRAIDGSIAAHELEAPVGESVKQVYLDYLNWIERDEAKAQFFNRTMLADWEAYPSMLHVRWFFLNEPERSRRVGRIHFTRWLMECDLPMSEREIMVYGFPTPPRKLRATWPDGLTTGQLESWESSAWLFRSFRSQSIGVQRQLDAYRNLAKRVALRLAQSLRERVHYLPIKTLGELVGKEYPPSAGALPFGLSKGDKALP